MSIVDASGRRSFVCQWEGCDVALERWGKWCPVHKAAARKWDRATIKRDADRPKVKTANLDRATIAELLERGPDMRFIGQSVKRTLRLARRGPELEALDLLHEGWLAWRDAIEAGKSEKQAYRAAEGRMEIAAEASDRLHRRQWTPDRARSVRRLTRADWRDLRAFVGRVLADAPAQLETILLLLAGRSIDEVARERGTARHTAYVLRSIAIRRLRAALAA